MDLPAEIAALKQRLYALQQAVAADLPREALPEGDLTVLMCRVAAETVAFLHTSLEEVVPMPTLTPVPESPPWVSGLLDLGGALFPVLDVQARVARQPREVQVTDFVVVVRFEGRQVGLVVQELLDVRQVSRTHIAPPPRDIPFAPYLLGLIKQEGAPVLLVSTARLVHTSDLPSELP